jgi:hypothetical protein
MNRRRLFGAVVLGAAILLLILGQTVLKGRLSPVVFVLYWMACFACTGLAILIAFLDARALSQKTIQEHRDLLQNALKEIETKARERAKSDGQGGKPEQN